MSAAGRVGVEARTLALEFLFSRRYLDFLGAPVCCSDVCAYFFLHGAVGLQGQGAIACGDAELEAWLADTHVLLQVAASANAHVELVAEIFYASKFNFDKKK